MLTVGLTGGIGSGKSAVANWLSKQAGTFVVDTDVVAHQICQPSGMAMPAIYQLIEAGEFPSTWVTGLGALNRAQVRGDCFSEPVLRRKLEAILHPLIREVALFEAEQIKKKLSPKLLVFVVPLLVEKKTWLPLVDQVWVVDCSPNTQKKRIRERSGGEITDSLIAQMMAAQATREERLSYADEVIANEDGLETLHQTLKNLLSKIG